MTCKVCRGAGAWPGPTSKRPDPPATCGGVLCRAVAEYSRADWAGQARMAQARQRAGIELTEFDRRALAIVESRAA